MPTYQPECQSRRHDSCRSPRLSQAGGPSLAQKGRERREEGPGVTWSRLFPLGPAWEPTDTPQRCTVSAPEAGGLVPPGHTHGPEDQISLPEPRVLLALVHSMTTNVHGALGTHRGRTRQSGACSPLAHKFRGDSHPAERERGPTGRRACEVGRVGGGGPVEGGRRAPRGTPAQRPEGAKLRRGQRDQQTHRPGQKPKGADRPVGAGVRRERPAGRGVWSDPSQWLQGRAWLG